MGCAFSFGRNEADRWPGSADSGTSKSGVSGSSFSSWRKLCAYRLGSGYQCSCRPNDRSKSKRYTTRKVDFFAAYIVPEDVWYIIPAAVVLKTKSCDLMLCPVQRRRRDSYLYEHYREAWHLLRSGKKPRAVAAEIKIPTLAAKISLGQGLQEVFECVVEFLWVVNEQGVAVPVEAFQPELVPEL